MNNLDLAKAHQLLRSHTEKTGTTAFLYQRVKKADLLNSGTCPRCKNKSVLTQEDDKGRTYSCGICSWAGWVPHTLIRELKKQGVGDMLAYILVKFYP